MPRLKRFNGATIADENYIEAIMNSVMYYSFT